MDQKLSFIPVQKRTFLALNQLPVPQLKMKSEPFRNQSYVCYVDLLNCQLYPSFSISFSQNIYMLLLCLMKVNRFRITRSFEKLRMNVPLAWVIWIALTIQAYSASPCLDTQLGVTKPVQHHKLCDNLDENLEFLLIRVQIVSCPVNLTVRCMD